jgi:hypothetical protein
MTHPIVTTVSHLVYEGNIESAERALVTVADKEGDFALARVIEEMAPRDLIAILREHDASHGTIITELISPRQFMAAISLESGYRERGHESLKGMISAVVFADESRTDEFIEALGSQPQGVDALVNYFSDRHEEIEFFFRNGTFSELDGDDFSGIPAADDDLDIGEPDDRMRRAMVQLREVEDHDWRELSWRLRTDHYEIFREILEILRRRHRQAQAEQQEAAAAAARAAAAAAAAQDDLDDEDDVL